jgi:hypothetical protein
MGDIPFARCVKSPARSRAFPAGGGIRIPETRPLRSELRVEDLAGLRQREFSAAPGRIRGRDAAPTALRRRVPGDCTRLLQGHPPFHICWTLTGPWQPCTAGRLTGRVFFYNIDMVESHRALARVSFTEDQREDGVTPSLPRNCDRNEIHPSDSSRVQDEQPLSRWDGKAWRVGSRQPVNLPDPIWPTFRGERRRNPGWSCPGSQ